MHKRKKIRVLTILLLALLDVASAHAQTQTDPALYRLIGTVESREFAGAVFDDSSGQKFYRLGEPMPDGSRIIKVESDSIVLKRSDGSSYEMFIARGTKSSPQQPVASAAPASQAPSGPARRAGLDDPAGQRPLGSALEMQQAAGKAPPNLQPGPDGRTASPRRRARARHVPEDNPEDN